MLLAHGWAFLYVDRDVRYLKLFLLFMMYCYVSLLYKNLTALVEFLISK